MICAGLLVVVVVAPDVDAFGTPPTRFSAATRLTWCSNRKEQQSSEDLAGSKEEWPGVSSAQKAMIQGSKDADR